ncbi:hypothetical protein DAPPUDRAFT_322630 [Daphnia pulex]|uniref:Uncharacterized protein n=1 Tax=Daphnia pulex TaxID=6669 RepID=E9GWK2_DAPPU|nr:hypothetical protein DAPPUDRAFT_322630 [Daphnia pulex]|eukprot:EFX76116.1 hypothetical protein DAPPUDRAFT_322630 [Daphnia pulex]
MQMLRLDHLVEMATDNTVAELRRTAISTIRQQSTELLETQDIKGCWALLDELFQRQFFYRLKLTPPYSEGKGKARYTPKRLHNQQHRPNARSFNTDHLTPAAKEKLCELEEEQKLQNDLAKEAAAKAALVEKQTEVFYQLSNIQRRQAELDN